MAIFDIYREGFSYSESQEGIRLWRWCLKNSMKAEGSAWPSLVSECNDLSIWLIWLMPTIKCLLKRTYGYEDVVWRISRWLFSSDIWMEWFNLFQVSMLHDASHQDCSREYMGWKKLFEKFHKGCLLHDHLLYLSGMKEAYLSLFLTWLSNQVSAQENKCVGRSCLKNSIKVVYCMTIFCIWVEWKKHIWVSFWPDFPIKFLLKRIYGLEEVVWKIQEGCLLHDHL